MYPLSCVVEKYSWTRGATHCLEKQIINMGGSQEQPLLFSLNNFLVNKKSFARKQRVVAGIKGRRHMKINKRCRRINLMKRRRTRNGEVKRKVKTLKKLVPNSSDTMGLDGLFRDTADYILALQMKVKVMQFMVNGLSSIDSDNIIE